MVLSVGSCVTNYCVLCPNIYYIRIYDTFWSNLLLKPRVCYIPIYVTHDNMLYAVRTCVTNDCVIVKTYCTHDHMVLSVQVMLQTSVCLSKLTLQSNARYILTELVLQMIACSIRTYVTRENMVHAVQTCVSNGCVIVSTYLHTNIWYFLSKLRKTFSKFYRRHYELVSKFNVGLKTLLRQGLSEPEFYGDLVYKFKKIVDRADFSDQFKKIIVRYKRIGYNINIMRQSACLVFNPITVNNFASLFKCTPVGRASDSMMAPT